jgi:hypothetical protein
MRDADLRRTRETVGDLAKVDAEAEHAKSPGELSQIRRALPEYPPRRTGAPTTYTPAVAEKICDRLENGELLAQILDDDGMPARQVVHQWLDAVPAFAVRYARARGHQAAALAERAVAEAWRELEPQHVGRARLRYDSAKWMASKLDPGAWGDKADVNVNVTDTASAERRAELIASLQRLAVSAPLIEGEVARDTPDTTAPKSDLSKPKQDVR